MNVVGFLLLVCAIGLTAYLTYTLVRDIREHRKRKKEDKTK